MKRRPFVKAGVTQARGSAVREDGKITTAGIARVHEYGGGRVPERSFLRSTLAKNQSRYDRQIAELRDQIFDGNSDMTVEKALALIGQSYSSDVKQTIRSGIAPPLAASTIARKNHAQIAKAKATVSRLSAKADRQGYTAAQKASKTFGPQQSGYGQKLSLKDSLAHQKATSTVLTGGASTALIDTGQMINALSYEVVMDGTATKEGE